MGRRGTAIDYERRTGEVIDRLERVRKPTIAMIHGVCVGGGASIALACDFRYADPTLRFGIPIARTLGNCLSLKGYSRLVDYVGPAKAKELIMLAKLLTGGRGAASRRDDGDRGGRGAGGPASPRWRSG